MSRQLSVQTETFPIAGTFAISRGARTEAIVVVAEIGEGGVVGRGECVPYGRYGETVEGVAAAVASMQDRIAAGLGRLDLQSAMPPGAARNAIDCALWDLEAKLSGIPAHVTAGLDRLSPVTTAYTISLGSADEMGAAAAKASARPILKIKLGAADGDDRARIAAVRKGAPDATLIADANEGWTKDNLRAHLDACAEAGFKLIEQPVPAAIDDMLASVPHDVALCADESLHDRAGLAQLQGRYDAINIKLDKAGGLTEALALSAEGQRLGFTIMIGCMLGTSLGMAPALLVAPAARFVDLDGPLLLARDRVPGLTYEGSLLRPPAPALWG